MNDLYAVLEQALYVEHKVKSLKNVLEMLSNDEKCEQNWAVQSIISVTSDSVECIADRQSAVINALDRYIAENAACARNCQQQTKTANGRRKQRTDLSGTAAL